MDKNPNISSLLDSSKSSTSFNVSLNTSNVRNVVVGKTPSKTPRRTPARGIRAFSPKTPLGADRFIPDRHAMNFDLSHYLMNNDTTNADPENKKATTMSELIGDLSNCRIVSYKVSKPPPPPEGHMNNLKVVYSSYKSSTTKKPTRYIPDQPERILDAPDIMNDYYLQLVDWSSTNILAVALKNEVYLWNAFTGNIDNLLTLDDPDYVSSLSWVQEGNYLAVGISDGKTQLWDTTKSKRLRTLNNSAMRISCMSWNHSLLSNGSKDGNIYNHDVRVASSLQSTFQSHTQEVCGLKWAPNGRLLASGGNDNTVNIWSISSGEQGSNSSSSNSIVTNPLYTFTDHQAAVKALAWCPWRSNCLASGGGTADRMIRIWNCQNGQNLYSVDTKSQVSALLWSSEYKELISSHGYMNNELIIWKYPALTKVAELIGHSARILGMAMSPDGSTVVSLGADETLRFWECFQVDAKTKKNKDKIKASKTNKENCMMAHSSIR